MVGVEDEFVLQDRTGMNLITVSIFDLFLDNEVMLIDVGNKGWLVKIGNVENQMNLRIDMNDSLAIFVSSLLNYQSYEVLLCQF